MATALSPAEALVLLRPNRTPGREAVKVTFLSLMAQGLLRIEEETRKGWFRKTRTVYVRPAGRMSRPLPPHTMSLMETVRLAQIATGSMKDIVARAREAYGANFEGFKKQFIMPALAARGLVEEKRILLLFRGWRTTPAGAAQQSRIQSDIERARTIPALLRSNPAEAAAIALAVGSTILLVEELRPYYRQLSQAMRPVNDGGDSSGDGGSWSTASDTDPHRHDHPDDPANPGAASLDALGADHFDFGWLDASAFDALDAGIASFDAGFDASAGHAGGNGGDGDGGGGNGGGGGD